MNGCGLILLISISNWFSCGGGNRTLDLDQDPDLPDIVVCAE